MVAKTVRFSVSTLVFVIDASVSVLTVLFKNIRKNPSSSFIEKVLSDVITVEFSFSETAVTSISPFNAVKTESLTRAFDTVSVPTP